MLRALHSLGNQLTDGGEIVEHMRRPRSVSQKHFFPFLVLISLTD
jgi:hypothetical protein